jgi:hypothetical protein
MAVAFWTGSLLACERELSILKSGSRKFSVGASDRDALRHRPFPGKKSWSDLR